MRVALEMDQFRAKSSKVKIFISREREILIRNRFASWGVSFARMGDFTKNNLMTYRQSDRGILLYEFFKFPAEQFVVFYHLFCHFFVLL